MSFSFEYTARNAGAALKILDKQYAPYCVKQFVSDAIRAQKDPKAPVYVKAYGHLHDGADYNVSTAEIKVQPFIFNEES